MSRKIIQIVAHDVEELPPALYALCDDGTLWLADTAHNRFTWIAVTPIPQDDDDRTNEVNARTPKEQP